MSKLLYLPIETKYRELDSALLVTHFALKSNFDIILGRRKYVDFYANKLNQGSYINKNISKPKYAKENHLKLIIMDMMLKALCIILIKRF